MWSALSRVCFLLNWKRDLFLILSIRCFFFPPHFLSFLLFLSLFCLPSLEHWLTPKYTTHAHYSYTWLLPQMIYKSKAYLSVCFQVLDARIWLIGSNSMHPRNINFNLKCTFMTAGHTLKLIEAHCWRFPEMTIKGCNLRIKYQCK